jgi:hypothetical protein
MNLEIIQRWLQREDDELVDFVEEKTQDIGDIEADAEADQAAVRRMNAARDGGDFTVPTYPERGRGGKSNVSDSNS